MTAPHWDAIAITLRRYLTQASTTPDESATTRDETGTTVDEAPTETDVFGWGRLGGSSW